MTCIGTVLSVQPRRYGKTTRMICDAIKLAVENPEKHILLCIPHIESLPELPTNITIFQTNAIRNIQTYVSGRSEEVVFIDHHIKDNTLIEQQKTINMLKEELGMCKHKLEKIKELVGSLNYCL